MKKSRSQKKLNQFFATAICGNDILSSTLYVSGIAIIFAGVAAPVVLLFVAFILFLYKSVYIEVVEALPMDGGAYNGFLNGTKKIFAALAGITTFLSYVATAVISSKVAMEYLHSLVPVPVISGAIILLFVFAILVAMGIGDSAKVAGYIFIFHLTTLIFLIIFGFIFAITGESSLFETASRTAGIIKEYGGYGKAFFFAFSVSLLSISGFHSSANFVEEQKPGVFRKTLRNMVAGVAIVNPLIAIIALLALPFDSIIAAKDFVLSDAAFVVGGNWLRIAVVFDAFLVLSGAVITSYLGMSGLIARMSEDECLPRWLIKKNRRQSHTRIIAIFFILSISILFITKGNILSLAGVYTIAFLGVMNLYAIGNIILKITRPELKRTHRASVFVVLSALFATTVGIVGNIIINPKNLLFFSIYFIPMIFIVLFLLYEDRILRILMLFTRRMPYLRAKLARRYKQLLGGSFLIFVHRSNRLYSMLRYISENEIGRKVILAHCARKNPHPMHRCTDLERTVNSIRKAGALDEFDITIVCKHEKFSPDIVKTTAKEFNVRPNRVFIGSVREAHPFAYSDMRGARIVF